MERLKAKEEAFSQFVNETRERPELRGMPLESYLHKPVGTHIHTQASKQA